MSSFFVLYIVEIISCPVLGKVIPGFDIAVQSMNKVFKKYDTSLQKID